MTRTRPTEKYAEYQAKLDAQHALISAMLNDELVYIVEPIRHRDRLSLQDGMTVTQCYIKADWASEVRVYHLTERTKGKKYINYVGTLHVAIGAMRKGLAYLDETDKEVQKAKIKQLEDLLAGFDAEGGKRL